TPETLRERACKFGRLDRATADLCAPPRSRPPCAAPSTVSLQMAARAFARMHYPSDPCPRADRLRSQVPCWISPDFGETLAGLSCKLIEVSTSFPVTYDRSARAAKSL